MSFLWLALSLWAPPVSNETMRLQVLLDRAGYSVGEIDGKQGMLTKRALAAYGQQNDASALKSDPTPVLVEYRIEEADLSGPYEKIPGDMMAKAKLQRLGYADVWELLGERFHSKPTLLKELNRGVTPAAGATLSVPNVLAPPAGAQAAWVDVVGEDMSVRAVNAEGKIIAWYPASAGSEHDPLPIGEWKINGVKQDPEFHYNPELFWNADPAHSKAKIAPGPNNPVGTVWIDLTKEHYGIHGTPEPAAIGRKQSHGCIRLTNWDAAELAGMVKTGVAVRIRAR